MVQVQVDANVPCIRLPELPQIPEVQLFGGITISGFLDFSKGMPTDCSVTFSIMQQLAPLLASLAPILNILGVVKALADFATNPLMKGPDLIAAIDKVASLFISLTPAGIAVTIAGILRVIIGFLKCFITQLEAVIDFQAQIGLIRAELEANPGQGSIVLQAQLSCAEANAEVSMQQVMASMGPIAPLLDIVTTVAGIAGLSLAMPSLSGGGGAADVIDSLKGAITSIEDVINSLPV